uniref:Uncharacterized protein n=1 Tax=Nelumbo nucifera TaxID=4432 RepID=A0A822Y7M0_NELNU|nr:TPA_asm: hypothetical protein HUJ06_028674 [Nelumbo nucifera]
MSVTEIVSFFNRNRKNSIYWLKDSDGIWSSDPLTIKTAIRDYFLDLFASSDPVCRHS